MLLELGLVFAGPFLDFFSVASGLLDLFLSCFLASGLVFSVASWLLDLFFSCFLASGLVLFLLLGLLFVAKVAVINFG